MTRQFVAAAFCLILAACTTGKPGHSAEAADSEGAQAHAASQPELTREQAEARAKQILNLTYTQEFSFDASKDSYGGQVDIAFDWVGSVAPLKIDFFNGKIVSSRFNNRDVDLKYDGKQLTLDPRWRGAGRQHLVMNFEHGYDPEGNGLYRFVDPKDGKIYLYSNLEPGFANVVFPCFDQPDLKATFAMTVQAPAAWIVTTATRPVSVIAKDDSRIWKFPDSPKMATYVWSLYAGDYHVFEDKLATYPQRLLTRQSLADQVVPEEWFAVARAGIQFYSEFFNVKYPYKKMDLVLVPDFSTEGMENIANIALTEKMLKKGGHTREEKMDIAELTLHEIAHMWFGDLVTMKWWDDLWLNESFASFMTGLSMPKAGYPGWRGFFSGYKQWAYETDDKVTSHPIESSIMDTSEANSEFDGITYGKGASVIKQLMYSISEEKFRAGLKIYFDRYHERNATLTDFIGSLEASSGRKLEQWTDQWLKSAGLNTATMDVACSGGKIKKAGIRQSAPSLNPTLREQAIQIGFLTGSEHLAVSKSFRVTFSGPYTEFKEMKGLACPKVVFPNLNDYGYARFRLDPTSAIEVKKSISKIEDPFIRQMAWSQLWAMVADGQMSVKEFAEIWVRNISHETDDENLVELFHYAHTRWQLVPSILMYYPRGADFDNWRRQADQTVWTELEKARPGSDRQKHLIDGFASLASQPDSLQKLAAMLDGTLRLPGFDLDQKRRWDVLQRLAEENFDGVLERIEAESKVDSSSIGEEEALNARVAIPSESIKKESLTKLFDDKYDWTFAQRRAVMTHLFPVEQLGLRNQFSANFFSSLEKFVGSEPKSDNFLDSYMTLAPLEPGTMRVAQDFLSRHTVLPETVNRALKELVESGEKFQKVRSRAEL